MDIRDRADDDTKLMRNFEDYHKVKLPKTKIVCPTCDGEGSHVNPDIDRNGIASTDELWSDEEFWEGYGSGTYDVTCYGCSGKNVVDVVDEDKLKLENNQLYIEWIEYVQDYWDDIYMQIAERRMGA
jgi:hypothetical protein